MVVMSKVEGEGDSFVDIDKRELVEHNLLHICK